ncbi:MAG: crossover junction endodeoxyribonuclease RuvC [Ignavibacteriae bacterium HGW-Ignavibacteriae-3]|nr:MAG: crossover junction endodeoxyribonuclease RuvC [Ignavibacteriae bacterium HGW-Ignavibacteriae-3]
MRILGIDPGTIFTGYGIIDFENNELKFVSSGVVKIPATKEMPPRLEAIYNELDKLIIQYKPDEFALETAFFGKNVQSALKIGYARGVSMLAAMHHGLSVKEYSPREIKKSVVGNGASTKDQVQYMIRKLLEIRKTKIKYDESDALAVAVCHAFKSNSFSKKSRNWKEFIRENPDRIIGA